MPSTERARELAGRTTPSLPFIDAAFAKKFVIACGLVPALVLAWDARQGQLGVNDVNFAIRTTGLLGLVFLTLSLVITPLRRMTGLSWLIATRRNLGVLGFAYLAAHFTIFFLYDRDGSVASTLEEITERVYLWFGTGSLLLMIPLAITSTNAMVTRLGARRWKLLHRTAYLAVAGGLVHYFLLVKADTTKPFVFTVVFGGLMLYRLVGHYADLGEVATAKNKVLAAKAAAGKAGPKRLWSGEVVVARIFQETHDVKTFRLMLPDGSRLPFEHVSGQYMNLQLVIDGKRVNRSYTIASSPTRSHHVEITVKRVPNGYASHYLHDRVAEGDRIKVSAPAGKFVFAGHESDRVILVAGGVGITPMMSVVRALTDRCWAGEMVLLFSVRARADVIFEHEIGELQKRFPNLRVRIHVSDEQGHVTADVVRAFVPDVATARGPVMLCGPAPMMTAMRALFVGLGVPDGQVLEEAFASPTGGAAEGSLASPEIVDGAAAGAIEFRRANRRVDAAGLTILECAEDAGVEIPFECRSGICGQCKTQVVSGRVVMEVQDALTAKDKAGGLVLACQARPVTDVVVDA